MLAAGVVAALEGVVLAEGEAELPLGVAEVLDDAAVGGAEDRFDERAGLADEDGALHSRERRLAELRQGSLLLAAACNLLGGILHRG